MGKPQSLAEFHFDKDKSGRILRKWADESGLTRAELAEKTGIPLNTLNNSLYGKVQDLSVDRTFKYAVATGHCVCEYIRLMLEDEDIDFADQIHVLRDVPMTLQKYVDTLPNPVETVPPKPLAQEETNQHAARILQEQDQLLDRFKRVYETVISQLKDQISQLKESRALMKEQYEHQLEAMERQHVIHNTAMERHHAESMQRADDERKRLQRQNSILRIALIAETAGIIALFFADALIGDRGWILRSWLGVGVNGTQIKG